MANGIYILSDSVLQAAGVVGFGLYVLNYSLLTFGALTSRCRVYFAINTAAALLVLAGLTVAFNLAAALIQCFWVVISLTGIILRSKPRRRRPVPFRTVRQPA